MNAHDASGRSLLQRLVDYRNRAEEMRILAETMHEESALVMRSIAAGYDRAANSVQAKLQSASLQR